MCESKTSQPCSHILIQMHLWTNQWECAYCLSYFIKSLSHLLTPESQHCLEGEGSGLDSDFNGKKTMTVTQMFWPRLKAFKIGR